MTLRAGRTMVRAADHHGVSADLMVDGVSFGQKYVGGSGDTVVWDPFGDLVKGDQIWLQICLVDGASDPTPAKCDDQFHTMQDG